MSSRNSSSSPSSLELKARLEKIKEGKKHARDDEREDDEPKKQHRLEETGRKVDKVFQEMMEECNGRGFVYCIRRKDGTFISGASDNLNGWWKEKLDRYDQKSSDHSNVGHSQGNNTTASPKDSEKDESP